MMNIRASFLLSALLLTGGCASVNYSLVPAEPVTVGSMTVTPAPGWNRAPGAITTFARPGSQVWTQDGPLLDRLLLIPDIAEGETLFKAPGKDVALPVFKAGMLPNELVQFTESSLVKLLGEGSSVIRTENVRPAKLGDQRAILFDVVGTPADGPLYRGMAASIVRDQKLNMIIFLAAEPYYYDKHKASVEGIFSSVRFQP
jgi:hypothetical protein